MRETISKALAPGNTVFSMTSLAATASTSPSTATLGGEASEVLYYSKRGRHIGWEVMLSGKTAMRATCVAAPHPYAPPLLLCRSVKCEAWDGDTEGLYWGVDHRIGPPSPPPRAPICCLESVQVHQARHQSLQLIQAPSAPPAPPALPAHQSAALSRCRFTRPGIRASN